MTIRQNIIDSIASHLPGHYGDISANFQSMPTGAAIGIVLPTFSRERYLIKTLESLKKTTFPKGCVLVIVDETMSIKQPASLEFEYFENIDFEGGDAGQVNGELEQIRDEAERVDSCVAFNECGWLKHTLVHPRQIKNSRFGTYIKKSFLEKNPILHQQIIELVQTYDAPIDSGVRAIIDAFDLNIPIIKIYKNQHGNMFDSLRAAFDLLNDLFHVRYLVNIDSDTIHKENWLEALAWEYSVLRGEIVDNPLVLSGFNADNKKNLYVRGNCVVKEQLGGMNLFFDVQTYVECVRDTLVNVGWDIILSRNIRASGGSLIAIYNSVVQHIGAEGMWSSDDAYDHSSTFHSPGAPPKGGLKGFLHHLGFMQRSRGNRGVG